MLPDIFRLRLENWGEYISKNNKGDNEKEECKK